MACNIYACCLTTMARFGRGFGHKLSNDSHDLAYDLGNRGRDLVKDLVPLWSRPGQRSWPHPRSAAGAASPPTVVDAASGTSSAAVDSISAAPSIAVDATSRPGRDLRRDRPAPAARLPPWEGPRRLLSAFASTADEAVAKVASSADEAAARIARRWPRSHRTWPWPRPRPRRTRMWSRSRPRRTRQWIRSRPRGRGNGKGRAHGGRRRACRQRHARRHGPWPAGSFPLGPTRSPYRA